MFAIQRIGILSNWLLNVALILLFAVYESMYSYIIYKMGIKMPLQIKLHLVGPMLMRVRNNAENKLQSI